jgi:hypothetical protein
MDGIVVSNHGDRQVDGAIGSLDALPGIANAVGDQVEVLFDSGVRTGADVVKALALGAKAVLVGRPWVYGLAHAGEAGVVHVLRSLLQYPQQSAQQEFPQQQHVHPGQAPQGYPNQQYPQQPPPQFRS